MNDDFMCFYEDLDIVMSAQELISNKKQVRLLTRRNQLLEVLSRVQSSIRKIDAELREENKDLRAY